jgi:MOSC domain-containing protein YiiM
MEAVQGTVAAVSCNDTYAFTKPVRDEIVLIAGVGVKGDVHAGVQVKHRGRVRADPTQPNFRQVHLLQQELFAEVGAKGYAVAAGNLGENVTTSGIDLLGLPLGTILRFGSPTPAHFGPTGMDGAGTVVDGARAVVDGASAVVGGAGAVVDGAGTVVGGGATAAGGGDGGPLGAGASGRDGGPLKAVLEVAARAKVDRETAASAVAIAAAAAGDRGVDLRPAVVLAGLRNPCGQINGFREGLLKEVVGRDADGNVVRKAGVMAVVLRGGTIRPGDAVIAELPALPHAPLERV